MHSRATSVHKSLNAVHAVHAWVTLHEVLTNEFLSDAIIGVSDRNPFLRIPLKRVARCSFTFGKPKKEGFPF